MADKNRVSLSHTNSTSGLGAVCPLCHDGPYVRQDTICPLCGFSGKTSFSLNCLPILRFFVLWYHVHPPVWFAEHTSGGPPRMSTLQTAAYVR
jgi:hypothetical protein